MHYLQERLLSTTNTAEHCNGLKGITSQQLVSTKWGSVIVTSSLVKDLGIDDEVLHIKLATLYDKSGMYILCNSIVFP